MTTHAVTGVERRPPIPASSTATDGDALVPIRGGLLASAAVVAVNALALAVIGFTGSYRSVRDLALDWGWGWFSYVFPVGIDVGIIGLIAADLFLCAIRTPAPILRWFAWVLTVATVVFNASSGWPPDGSAGWMDYVEAAAHATMPGLVVVITEALRRAIARRARIADGRQFEPLGIARWVLAPFATFGVWRRMRLWSVYTRAEALDLERDRLTLRDELREKYGRKWKEKARPVELRAMRDAGRGLPIPAQLIANAALPPANADRANAANAAPADPTRPAAADGGANAANAGAYGVGAPTANDVPVAAAAANGHLVDMETVRTPGGPASEHPAFAATEPAPQMDADLRDSHRERATVPAAAPARSIVRSTVPAPYSPVGPVTDDGGELVGANAAVLTANAPAYTAGPTVNGANGYREAAAGAAAGEEREHLAERYTEDRAGRRRLAEDFLRAKGTEQPPPSQARFAERVGVAPATVSKAMKEWREDHDG
ncbi:DUF2637 domain-containing protein [Streptomyces salinarius]|uniref:DUF2637 domain-containing protein n=1 Tax=Streptomyces salinarius TaxID=2762598 RepID=UPI001648198D|nr:DUF2637 domain-containing protein [Streptomyces salinarius]